MATLILDSQCDTRPDEVWEGVSVMSPDPNNPHTRIRDAVYLALYFAVQVPGRGTVATGANVSDRNEGWVKNYRIPDVIVYLKTNSAIDWETHYEGGPDFALEVLSEGEDGEAKLGFYAAVQTREVLVIDRNPWLLTLYRLAAGRLIPVSPTDLMTSETTGVTFTLDQSGTRPVVVATTPCGQSFRA